MSYWSAIDEVDISRFRIYRHLSLKHLPRTGKAVVVGRDANLGSRVIRLGGNDNKNSGTPGGTGAGLQNKGINRPEKQDFGEC